MKRWILSIIVITVTFSTFGCRMCCGPYDYDYPNFSENYQRVDPTYGRVGSIFSDPNASFTGDSPDSNLAPQPDPRKSGGDGYDKEDLDKLKRELEGDLELIDPLNDRNPGQDTLPNPENDETTASRLWKRKPLRSGQAWR